MAETFRDVAAALAANGYLPVPIRPGTKRPALDDWQKYRFHPGDENFYAKCGCGALCGELVVPDIDVRHPELAARIEAVFAEALGVTPRRVGAAPKVALLYRTDKPFRKISSIAVRLPGDAPGAKPHQVEILGEGQQILFYGQHPDGFAYRWNGIGDPLEHPLASLHTITEQEIVQIIERVNAILVELGEPAGRLARATSADATPNTELLAYNPDECIAAVEFFPNDDLSYDDWIYYGHAIKGALGPAGRDVFLRWSAQSKKYDPEEADRAWRSFAPTRIGAGTIYKLAFSRGWQRPIALVDITGLLGKDAPVNPARCPLDWADLGHNPPPAREWAIDNWLGVGHVTLLAGRGGVGKTLLMQQMASAIALGRPFLDGVERPRVALLWCAEDDADELRRRQLAIAEWLGVPVGTFGTQLIVQPLAGVDCALVTLNQGRLVPTAMAKELWEQINDYHATFVGLDNIAHLFAGNENDRYQVTAFANMATGIALAARCAVTMAGHPAKGLESEFSGSTAWENAVRGRLYLSRTPPDADDKQSDPLGLTRYVSKRKANYSALDCKRFTYVDGTLRQDDGISDSPLINGIKDRRARDLVLTAIGRLKQMGVFGNASRSTQNYLPKLMVLYSLSEGVHISEIEKSMRDLMADGTIKIDRVGQYANRTPKLGLIVP